MKSSEFHRIIVQNGWVCVRSNGSHRVYRKGDEVYIVAYHGAKEMGEGLRLKLLKR